MKTKKLLSLAALSIFTIQAVSAQSVNFPSMPRFPNLPNNIPGNTNGSTTIPGGTFQLPNFPTIPNVGTSSIRVRVVKFVNGSMANASSTNNAVFTMNAVYNASSTGQGSGTYVLAPIGYNGNQNSYQAMTIPLNIGASYGTSEVLDNVVGQSCVASTSPTYKPFALSGYSVGNSLNEAVNANKTLTAPNFLGLTSDKYVIVWNTNCANPTGGQIGGDVSGGATSTLGILKVDSIETQSSNGLADNSFANGFKYIFNITVPTNETKLVMKFADWINTTNSSAIIPAAGNIRFSSAQANSTAGVVITNANIYPTEFLTITGDLDNTLSGRQIKILIETKIPLNTVNGPYTTTYGIRTQ